MLVEDLASSETSLWSLARGNLPPADVLHTCLIRVSRTEADPELLASYVIALLKHDKPRDELRRKVTEELEAFLKGGTFSSFSFPSPCHVPSSGSPYLALAPHPLQTRPSL